MSDVTDMIFHQCAQNRAARERIPLGVALARVKADAAAASQDRQQELQQLRLQQQHGQPQEQADPRMAPLPTTVPPLPPAGSVTDVRTAREFLSRYHPAWEGMGHQARHDAAVRLRDLQPAPLRAKLSAKRSTRPTLLLCLFEGPSPLARARAYLAGDGRRLRRAALRRAGRAGARALDQP